MLAISCACRYNLLATVLNTLVLKESFALYNVSFALRDACTSPLKSGDINPDAILSVIFSISAASLNMLLPVIWANILLILLTIL